jgi:hypothetical protein
MDKDIEIKAEPLPKSLFKKYFIMAVVGMVGTGKSMFVIRLYKKFLKKMFDRVIIFTNSDDMKSVYLNKMEAAAEIYGTDQLENFNDIERKRFKKIPGVYDYLKETNSDKNDRILMIVDDYYSKDISKDVNLNKVFISGRHVNTSVIFICQYIWKMMSELMKNNVFIYVFFKNDIKSWSVIEGRITNTLSIIYPEIDKKKLLEIAKKIYKQVYLIDYNKIILTSDHFYSF